MSAAMAIVKELTEKHEKRIAELEAALRECELILTALAMSLNRQAVCSDEKLSAALEAVRALLK